MAPVYLSVRRSSFPERARREPGTHVIGVPPTGTRALLGWLRCVAHPDISRRFRLRTRAADEELIDVRAREPTLIASLARRGIQAPSSRRLRGARTRAFPFGSGCSTSSTCSEQMSYQLTMLAYDMNGEPLSFGHGAPLRLRNETQLGFKQVKCDRERHSRHRSRMRSFCGREQHVNRWPAARAA
jgi:hypothetical protein